MRASSLVVAPVTRTAVTATSEESRSHSQPPTEAGEHDHGGEAAQERAAETHWGRLRRPGSDPCRRNFAGAGAVWVSLWSSSSPSCSPARSATSPRDRGLVLYLVIWALVLPIQTIVVHSENPDDINAAYPVVNALILAGGVALNRLGAAMRGRRTSTPAG